MHKLLRIIGISLLASALISCGDSSDDQVMHSLTGNESVIKSGQKISLLKGDFTLYLPKNMHDKNGQLENQTNNMHVYTSDSGRSTALVIFSDYSNIDALPSMLDNIELQLRTRDDSLEVTVKKASVLENNQTIQRLDTITQIKGQKAYTSNVLGMVDQQLFTLRITLPATDPTLAEKTIDRIIQSLQINS